MKIINSLIGNKPADIEECLSILDKNNEMFKNKKEYEYYKNNVTYNFRKFVVPEYPLLHLFHRNMKPSYITGYNVSHKSIEDVPISPEHYRQFGMDILAYIPKHNKDKSFNGCLVYDVYNLINYDLLRSGYNDICHLDNVNNYPFNHICTNKIKDIGSNNYLYTPITVALRLYLEYRKVDGGGKFELECYPHGGNP